MRTAKPMISLSLSVFAAATLVGCMSVGTPASSVARLARMQPLEADPGAIRFAVATPAFMRLRDGDITVTVKYDAGDKSRSFVEQYKPVVTEEGDAPGIDRARLGGARLSVARFHEDDIQAFRAMQERIAADEAAGKKGKGSLTVGASGCRVAAVPAGPLPLSAWLRIAPGEDYVQLMRDYDLAKQLRAAGVDPSDMPLCADAPASG